MTLLRFLICVGCALLSTASWSGRIVNVYLTGGEVPQSLIWAFQKETGIKVNLSTYDSNETMYAKLHASKKNFYDVILPSSYFVERMKKYDLLTKLDVKKLPNLKNLNPFFKTNPYDPNNEYHVPLLWGVTGIFYNQHWIKHPPKKWQDLWNPKLTNQLMLVDDMRDVFSISLMSLGYKPNDDNHEHIKEAYLHLLALVPNIKLFASDAIQSLIIDEDANIGASWNGDIVKAQAENHNVRFVYPEDGILMWVDCLAIPKNAPHLDEAYEFINFLLRAQSGATIVLNTGYSATNQASIDLLPKSITQNPYIYPEKSVVEKGYYQRDISEEIMELYNVYWEQLKLAC
ncbi:MAG: spermidine/putrescine ABC transporter substrate-binding protein [Legionella sp.]|nr:MAG: spermidine/putrescine ABC transporter substrate-binding protein [Legionella sp.]